MSGKFAVVLLCLIYTPQSFQLGVCRFLENEEVKEVYLDCLHRYMPDMVTLLAETCLNIYGEPDFASYLLTICNSTGATRTEMLDCIPDPQGDSPEFPEFVKNVHNLQECTLEGVNRILSPEEIQEIKSSREKRETLYWMT